MPEASPKTTFRVWAEFMQRRLFSLVFLVVSAALLSACASGEKVPNLMNIRQTSPGPDEFSIVPPKALEAPPDLHELPPPTPGGANRTDQTPGSRRDHRTWAANPPR